jgi:F0F1-type ATP synthase gamma subunit
LTSDKGLCGGINSGIIRNIKATIGLDRTPYKIFNV